MHIGVLILWRSNPSTDHVACGYPTLGPGGLCFRQIDNLWRNYLLNCCLAFLSNQRKG